MCRLPVDSQMDNATSQSKKSNKGDESNEKAKKEGIAPGFDLSSNRRFAFPWKLHQLLHDAVRGNGNENTVSWMPSGRAFKVHNRDVFVSKILPTYFRQTTFKSFQRQLYMYGFERISSGNEKGSYHHPMFVKGNRELTFQIQRIPQTDNSATAVAVEVSSRRQTGLQPSSELIEASLAASLTNFIHTQSLSSPDFCQQMPNQPHNAPLQQIYGIPGNVDLQATIPMSMLCQERQDASFPPERNLIPVLSAGRQRQTSLGPQSKDEALLGASSRFLSDKKTPSTHYYLGQHPDFTKGQSLPDLSQTQLPPQGHIHPSMLLPSTNETRHALATNTTMHKRPSDLYTNMAATTVQQPRYQPQTGVAPYRFSLGANEQSMPMLARLNQFSPEGMQKAFLTSTATNTTTTQRPSAAPAATLQPILCTNANENDIGADVCLPADTVQSLVHQETKPPTTEQDLSPNTSSDWFSTLERHFPPP